MWKDQISTHKVAELGFAFFAYHSGLFGLIRPWNSNQSKFPINQLQMTPNKWKKCEILIFNGIWPLIWPSRPSLAFFNFSEILDVWEVQWYVILLCMTNISLETVLKWDLAFQFTAQWCEMADFFPLGVWQVNFRAMPIILMILVFQI